MFKKWLILTIFMLMVISGCGKMTKHSAGLDLQATVPNSSPSSSTSDIKKFTQFL